MPSPSSAARGRNPRGGQPEGVKPSGFFCTGPEQGNWPGSEITFILINFILVIFVKCVIIKMEYPVRPPMVGVCGIYFYFLDLAIDIFVICVILLT